MNKETLEEAEALICTGDFGAACVFLTGKENPGFDRLLKGGPQDFLCLSTNCGRITRNGSSRLRSIWEISSGLPSLGLLLPGSVFSELLRAAQKRRSSELYAFLGAAFLLEGKSGAARRFLDRSLRINPHFSWPKILQVQRALLLAENKQALYRRLPACLTLLDEILARESCHEAALRMRAMLRADMEAVPEAKKDLTRLLRLNPLDAWARVEKAEILCDEKDFQGALKELAAIPRRHAAEAWYWAFRGRALALAGRDKEGLRCLERAVRMLPSFAPFHSWHGEALRKFARYKEALKAYSQAILCDPNFIYGYEWRGRVYLMLGRYKEALRDLKVNIVRGWHHYYAASFRGEAYFKTGRFERAARDLDLAYPLNPRLNWNPLVREGERPAFDKEAVFLKDLDDAVRRHSGAWPLAIRGRCRVIDGEISSGLFDLTESLKKRETWFARKWRGFALLKGGLAEAALADLKLAGEDPWACAWRGRALAMLGKHKRALKDYEKALKTREPRFSQVHQWRAESFMALGRKKEAELEARRAFRWLRLNQGAQMDCSLGEGAAQG